MDPIMLDIEINGERRTIEAAPNLMLIDLLRDGLHLKGAQVACDAGVCGACTVLLDGAPFSACTTFAFVADKRSLTTIEGLGANGALDPIQEAFKAKSAFQCGYCTPGMILLAKALLAENPSPSRAQIRAHISANICRCTGYQMIVEAIEDATARMAAAGGGK